MENRKFFNVGIILLYGLMSFETSFAAYAGAAPTAQSVKRLINEGGDLLEALRQANLITNEAQRNVLIQRIQQLAMERGIALTVATGMGGGAAATPRNESWVVVDRAMREVPSMNAEVIRLIEPAFREFERRHPNRSVVAARIPSLLKQIAELYNENASLIANVDTIVNYINAIAIEKAAGGGGLTVVFQSVAPSTDLKEAANLFLASIPTYCTADLTQMVDATPINPRDADGNLRNPDEREDNDPKDDTLRSQKLKITFKSQFSTVRGARPETTPAEFLAMTLTLLKAFFTNPVNDFDTFYSMLTRRDDNGLFTMVRNQIMKGIKAGSEDMEKLIVAKKRVLSAGEAGLAAAGAELSAKLKGGRGLGLKPVYESPDAPDAALEENPEEQTRRAAERFAQREARRAAEREQRRLEALGERDSLLAQLKTKGGSVSAPVPGETSGERIARLEREREAIEQRRVEALAKINERVERGKKNAMMPDAAVRVTKSEAARIQVKFDEMVELKTQELIEAIENNEDLSAKGKSKAKEKVPAQAKQLALQLLPDQRMKNVILGKIQPVDDEEPDGDGGRSGAASPEPMPEPQKLSVAEKMALTDKASKYIDDEDLKGLQAWARTLTPEQFEVIKEIVGDED